jgi:hypothetical protein
MTDKDTADEIALFTDDPLIAKATEFAYRMSVMYKNNPRIMELDSFMIAGVDLNGDVQVGCWELTEDMMQELVDALATGNRIYLDEPRRSN